jgi:hypothetical protein
MPKEFLHVTEHQSEGSTKFMADVGEERGLGAVEFG